MKWMTQLRLVNWHYFPDETMEFGQQTLISGRNTSGKSTIIDALQVLLIADQRQIRFNPAAHAEAKRSLINYLRGKIGTDQQSFVREGDFTSYIISEFRDAKSREHFVIGVVIDVYRDDRVEEEYFILPQTKLAKVEVVNLSGQLRNREEFHRYAQNLSKKAFLERGKSIYQKAFLARMGQLPDRFFQVFSRALSFKPIHNIRDFVYENILDQRELKLDLLKQNFDIYERYKNQLEDLQERKNALEAISNQFLQVSKSKELVAIQDYVLRRLRYEEQVELYKHLESFIGQLEGQVKELETNVLLVKDQLKEAQVKAQESFQAWNSHKLKLRQAELDKQISVITDEITKKAENLRVFGEKLDRELRLVDDFSDWTGNEFWQWSAGGQKSLAELVQLLINIKAFINSDTYDLDLEGTYQTSLLSAFEFLSDLQTRFERAAGRVEERLTKLITDKESLEKEIEDLENKKRRYPDSLQNLKSLLESRFREKSPVWVLCEEMEVVDECWRDAIEGYLHTQRFDLLVKPEVFSEALALYEREKRTYKLEGVGLVDTEKESRFLGRFTPNSLAESLSAENPIIMARIHHLLGNVMKARDEQDLRNYSTSITQSCMSYNRLVARQIPLERYAVPYIGAKAIARQLEIKKEELRKLGELEVSLRTSYNALNNWAKRLANKKSDYQLLANNLSIPRTLKDLETNRKSLEDELNRLDLSEVERLKENYDYWYYRQQELTEKLPKISAEHAARDNELSYKLTELATKQREVQEHQNYWQEWKNSNLYAMLLKAEERWSEAEAQSIPIATKITNWESNRKRNVTILEEQELPHLYNLRRDYNSANGLKTDIDSLNNDDYDTILKQIDTVNIPEYQEKVNEALRQSEEEFKSHFIFRLREEISKARREFRELNEALKNFPFHEDKYHFEISSNDHFRRYYDVIMDSDLVQRGSLFDNLTDEKGDALHELFEKLIHVGPEEQEEFTDYRNYLDYDIEVTGASGRYLFSSVLKEKSGGETQTPFYIAILASFYQLYSSGKSSRLVVFDEAFNKMDEERIQTSLRLIKRLNLQLIAAVPDEKMQHMVPEVQTTLVVHRDGHRCFVDMISRDILLEEGKAENDPNGGEQEEVLQGPDSLFTT